MTQRVQATELARLGRLAKVAGEHLHAARPPNWDGKFPDHVKMTQCVDRGIAVTWVPSRETLGYLLDAEGPEDVDHVLADRAESITNDCLQLAETLPQTPSRAALRAAGAAHSAGHHEASQALATTLTSHTLVDLFLTLSQARKTIANLGDPDQYLVSEYRTILTVRAAGPALTNFAPGTNGIPGRYNRHASAHTISPDQYTGRNSTIALMLAASLTAESHHSEMGE